VQAGGQSGISAARLAATQPHAVRALSEDAVHSHTRRGLADGLAPEELKQVALLAIPALGFPQGEHKDRWGADL
jgi:alkylhydroperoxidase/carboxymuconolactone decarboxylase family protein YurZ